MTGAGVHMVFYLNIFLLAGVALRHFFKRLSAFVPYTVLLLILGVILGGAARPHGSLADALAELASNSSDGSSGGSSRQLSEGSGSSSGSEWATPRADYFAIIDILALLDPHTMLYIFLPALLFESAQAIDFHVFKKVTLKTVTLAFPGMVC